MISEFRFENFKSCRSVGFPLSSLSLLIGANASGKSNIIEAIRLLSWLAQGRHLDDIRHAVQSEDQMLRGTIDDVCHFGKESFVLSCLIEADRGTSVGSNRFAIELGAKDGQLRILSERLAEPGSKVPYYQIKTPASDSSNEIQVEYNNYARGGKKPCIACIDQQAVFTQLETPARFAAGNKKAQEEIPQATSRLRRSLRGILFLDPSPRLMRDYSYQNETELNGDGANLSAVLRAVVKGNGHAEGMGKKPVLDFVRFLPEQDIVDIDFIETERKEVMVRLTESFGHREDPVDAPLLSDGTLRVLAIAAALLSAPEGTLVVIEEIDNGVHPNRADKLMAKIMAVAKERHLRILLTTHNPALLNALPEEAVPKVLCTYRCPETGDTDVKPLSELARYPELVSQGPLGDLVAAGVLEKSLKDTESSTERRKRSLEWLDALEKGE